MHVIEELWGTIPLLHVTDDLNDKIEQPIVIYLHGFTSAKEHNLHYAYNLAKKGIRVLLPDAHLHGVRDEGLDDVQLSLRFWEIVLTSIKEVAYIKEEAKNRGLLYNNNMGVAGTSMGGITTLGCVTAYPWIEAAAVMMGAAGFVELAKAQIAQFERKGFRLPITVEEKDALFQTLEQVDLTEHPEKLANRPLFFWHGENDSVVPFEPTYAFYESIQPAYHQHPNRLQFMRDELAGHAVSRDGMLCSTDWLATYLKGDGLIWYDERSKQVKGE